MKPEELARVGAWLRKQSRRVYAMADPQARFDLESAADSVERAVGRLACAEAEPELPAGVTGDAA